MADDGPCYEVHDGAYSGQCSYVGTKVSWPVDTPALQASVLGHRQVCWLAHRLSGEQYDIHMAATEVLARHQGTDILR